LQRRNHGFRWNIERSDDERDEKQRDETGDDEGVEILAYGGAWIRPVTGSGDGFETEREPGCGEDADEPE
jgi:hypothetical protein